ncbi:MAG: efflux RND transporter periplasmic adaptor subunit [Gemmataceae bacterium]
MRVTYQGLLLLVPIMAGCDRTGPKLAPSKAAVVEVSSPLTKTVTEYEVFTGRTDAVRTVDLRARVTGYLDKVNFKEGNDINEGDILFEIDPRTYKAELERAEANLSVAEAHAARLERDFRRIEPLFKNGVATREDYDKVSGDREEAVAQARVARAGRDLAKLNLSFCKVTAPVSGRISRSLHDTGNLVKADETLLTTIVTLDPMYAYFDVDERTLLRLRRLVREGRIRSARDGAADVTLGLTDEEGFPMEGKIDFIDNKLDANTGTLRLRGVFPNPKKLLSPGLFVRVRMPVGDPHPATLISEQALGTDQGNKFVYVVVDGKNKQGEVVKVVAQRRVKIGILDGGLRVIEEGLSLDESVIVTGLQRVKPGAEVDPKAVAMPVVGGGTEKAETVVREPK